MSFAWCKGIEEPLEIPNGFFKILRLSKILGLILFVKPFEIVVVVRYYYEV